MAAVLFGGVVAGNYLSQKFILRANPDEPGFITQSNGFGLDDLATAGVITLTVWLLDMVVPG